MEYSILQKMEKLCIMKIQERNESNVLTNHPFKTVESKRLRKMMEPNNCMK